MAETYRKSKVEQYVQRLLTRKATLRRQLEQAEYAQVRDFLSGQMYAVDSIIQEIAAEFHLPADKSEE